MIVWIASFPRSGNSLLRQLLWQVFGQNTFSRNNDKNNIGRNRDVAEIIGHLNYESSWAEFYAKAHQSNEPVFFIKTHEPPRDYSKAIYIVRDGRAAIVSYYHLLCDNRGGTDTNIAMAIRGEAPFSSWTSHLEDWQPLARANCLLLRFEDMIEKTEECIKKIASFTGLTPNQAWANPLAKLRNVMPSYFRRGSNQDNIKELNEINKSLFWERHGAWMTKLGYRKHE
jgi:hypothetical protein